MTATDRSKAAWERALADPSAVCGRCRDDTSGSASRPNRVATLSAQPRESGLGNSPAGNRKRNGGMVRRTDPRIDDASEAVGTYGNRPAGPRCHACDREYLDELRDEAENGNANERVICKHLTKLGRSPDATDGISLLTPYCRSHAGPGDDSRGFAVLLEEAR